MNADTQPQTGTSRSEQQARAQLDTLIEMVNALDIDGAAEHHVSGLSRSEMIVQIRKHDLAIDTRQDTDDLRDELAGELAGGAQIDGFSFDEDAARDAIQEDPLSIEVRTGWHTPGAEAKPDEFCILLCTGGPAVRIVGDLNEYGEPTSARIEHQDWGTPWAEMITTSAEQDLLLTYCQQFYFGE